MSENEMNENEKTTEDQNRHAMKVNIQMRQNEYTSQPVYSNITATQVSQGVVLVDFGFLDPQTVQTLNRMAQSGEKQQTVSARMSSRVAISPDAASQLTRQLTQLLQNAETNSAQSKSE